MLLLSLLAAQLSSPQSLLNIRRSFDCGETVILNSTLMDVSHISFKKTDSGGLHGSSPWERRTQEAPACVEGCAFIWPRSRQVISLFTLPRCSSLWPGHYWLPRTTPFSQHIHWSREDSPRLSFSIWNKEKVKISTSLEFTSKSANHFFIGHKFKSWPLTSVPATQTRQPWRLLSLSSSWLNLGLVKTSGLIN